MDNKALHQEIQKHLISYHRELYTFSAITMEFRAFEALDSRKFLETHKSSMNDTELLMLTVVDKLALEVYKSVKNDTNNEFITPEDLKNEDDFIDLQKAVLIAKKNLKDNPFIDKATKVQNLNYSDLIFNSCVVETL